jgi:hypothetical protein
MLVRLVRFTIVKQQFSFACQSNCLEYCRLDYEKVALMLCRMLVEKQQHVTLIPEALYLFQIVHTLSFISIDIK